MPLGLELRSEMDLESGNFINKISQFNYELPDGSIMLKSGLIFIGTTLEEDKEEIKECLNK